MKRRYFAILVMVTGLLLGVQRFILLSSKKIGEMDKIQPQLPKAKTQAAVLDAMPVKLGAKRVAFQLNTFLPQVHLTLVSVLQGLALGVLISQFDSVPPMSFPAGLLYLASIIGIAFTWHLYASAFIAFLWPYSWMHTIIQFLLAAVECFAFASISQPVVWSFGIAGVALIGALVRWMNTRIVSDKHYEQKAVYLMDRGVEVTESREMLLLAAYVNVFGLVLLAAATQVSPYFDLLTALAALSVGIGLILLLIRNRGAEVIRAHLANSPWEFDNQQLIERDQA